MCSVDSNREETEMLMNRACTHRMQSTRFFVGSSPDFSFAIKFLILASGMKIQLKTVAAVFAGVGIGIVAMHGLQGGQAKPPPAFGTANGHEET